MIQVKTLIRENTGLAPGYYRLKLMAPEIAAAAQPGQFIQLRVARENCTDPLLARPISIYWADPDAGTVELIYKTVGRGTVVLAQKQPGEILEVFGPIGNGFRVPPDVQRLALIGGGVGMPPLYFLAATLKHERPETAVTLFYGGRCRRDLLELERWHQLGVAVKAATEDGSFGTPGLVTTVLLKQLEESRFDYLAACGPRPMLQALRQLALEHRIPGALSLEAHMACGIGACLGCTCKTDQGYRRVCVDGPVFDLSEVNLND